MLSCNATHGGSGEQHSERKQTLSTAPASTRKAARRQVCPKCDQHRVPSTRSRARATASHPRQAGCTPWPMRAAAGHGDRGSRAGALTLRVRADVVPQLSRAACLRCTGRTCSCGRTKSPRAFSSMGCSSCSVRCASPRGARAVSSGPGTSHACCPDVGRCLSRVCR